MRHLIAAVGTIFGFAVISFYSPTLAWSLALLTFVFLLGLITGIIIERGRRRLA